ncbi:winged helix-turn-helix domain-containing protein [Microvirga sesbaniae]|uniref:winged helix-turn-helix domain-containing protein n=1 Tax=Microvirga sesbaniae TaxID=681392 RepID=UPI00358DA818
MAAGFATDRSTLERIAVLIERELGVHYHPGYLERPHKGHGFSVQRPAIRGQRTGTTRDCGLAQARVGGAQKGAPRALDPPARG